MPSNKLYILLCSGEREKVQMAAMIASVAAVSDRSVEVFVSMNALLAFSKNVSLEKRYYGGTFSKLLMERKAPDPIALLRQGREFGDLKLWACSMALDVQGWDIHNLEDELFDDTLGLTKFLSDAENGQFIAL